MYEPTFYTLRTLNSLYSNRRLWEYFKDHLTENVEAHVDLVDTACFACLLHTAEKREKLQPDRRSILEDILTDMELQRSLDDFLQDALKRREPAALLDCLVRHRASIDLADAHLQRLLEGVGTHNDAA